jgi:hypothetical protein
MIMIVIVLCHLCPPPPTPSLYFCSKKNQILKMIDKYLRKNNLIRKKLTRGTIQKMCSILLTLSGSEKTDDTGGHRYYDIYFDILSDEGAALLLGNNYSVGNGEETALETLMDNFKHLMYFIFKNKILFRKSIGENVYKLMSLYPPLNENSY